jgi:hypothetical protein
MTFLPPHDERSKPAPNLSAVSILSGILLQYLAVTDLNDACGSEGFDNGAGVA